MSEFTRLTVDLTDHAVIALNAAANTTGDSRTDTVNRALQLYAGITAVADLQGCGVLTFELSKSGKRVRVDVNRPWWRFW